MRISDWSSDVCSSDLNIETGVAYRRDGFDLSASYFWSKSNLGSRIQVIGGAGVIQREKTKIRGLELSASYSFPAGTRIGAKFAALEGRYESNGDNVVDTDLDGRNIQPIGSTSFWRRR